MLRELLKKIWPMKTTVPIPESGTVSDSMLAGYSHFGVCPKCGKNDGYFNYNRMHYFICHHHKAMWCVGSNLFSGWREESQEVWDRNAKRFENYEKIEPHHPELPFKQDSIQPISVAIAGHDQIPF